MTTEDQYKTLCDLAHEADTALVAVEAAQEAFKAVVKKYADVLNQGPSSTPWQASLDG